MALAHESMCGNLLLDILFYEKSYGRLSPEMEYLFEQHLKTCSACRHRTLSFQRVLREPIIVRNYG
jgi:hypothetical protein